MPSLQLEAFDRGQLISMSPLASTEERGNYAKQQAIRMAIAITHPGQGLTEAEAQARLAIEGFNELPRARRRTPIRIVFEVLREPMLALLLSGGAVYLLLGNREEALILTVFACLSVAITVVQETRSERVLEALRDLSSPRALVIRDGQRKRIAGRDVARGDLIVLSEGDRVPADGRLIKSTGLLADELLLTGESAPVRKTVTNAPSARPGGEDLPFVFSGSLITGGSALAEATATGLSTEIGKIGVSLRSIEIETPHLQRQSRRLVIVFAALGAAVSAAVVGLYGYMRGSWLEAILAGIAVEMSMLPEEFPMVLAVFTAMGAWRISKARVLTRRASAIEALGSASVLCTDKTGTLTENRMTIVELRLPDGSKQQIDAVALSAPFRRLASVGTLASAPRPFDPMEKAFHDLAPLEEGRTLLRSYPLAPNLLAMTQVWGTQGSITACAKGAPEAIFDLCQMSPEERVAITAQINEMANSGGLRVLGIAFAEASSNLPETQSAFDYHFLGLVGFSDPLRSTVPAAMDECRAAGIRVIMITGDYPETAQAIAQEAGLDGNRVIAGKELAEMDDKALAAAVRSTTIFARIVPEQKLRIVKALKANGEVVAMTGDGVNDASSLKAAHIGIAMGGRGTDVAREAASIVLLDDDFSSIVKTIRLGRRINDNLRKAMSFILAVHVPIAGLAVMPLLLGVQMLFAPVHIAFLEMIIDPVCSLVFEAEGEEDGIMRRPPRPASDPLFSWPTILWSVVQGGLVFGAAAMVLWFAPDFGLDARQVRTLAFLSLVVGIVTLILVDRSASSSVVTAILRPNTALMFVLPIVAGALAVIFLVEPARQMFGFEWVEGTAMLIPLLAAIAILLVLEVVKTIWRFA